MGFRVAKRGQRVTLVSSGHRDFKNINLIMCLFLDVLSVAFKFCLRRTWRLVDERDNRIASLCADD